jgi:DNA-3-methyladenine glycosylase II
MERTVSPLGRFSLAASTAFLEGFTPAAYASPAAPGHLHLAYPLSGDRGVAGVCARQPSGPDGPVVLEAVVDGGDARAHEAALDQLERILSLDIDGRGYEAVGERDPAIGRLQAQYPGLRPVLFLSPYEAAAWAIIGARIAIRQAARVKAAMARDLGTTARIHDDVLAAFPAATRLATLDHFPGLFGRKPEYLRGVAAAELDGRLDIERLRALPDERILDELRTIPGLGPFSAELVLLRAVGTTDRAPVTESRLPRAVALAYGRPEPTRDELAELTETWRPFRMWVTLLVRTSLEEETHEIRDGRGRASGAGPSPAPEAP